VNELFAEELRGQQIHAFSVKTYTAEEYDQVRGSS
jgi:acid stress-induced BolA-like protein IbaG/YrbA